MEVTVASRQHMVHQAFIHANEAKFPWIIENLDLVMDKSPGNLYLYSEKVTIDVLDHSFLRSILVPGDHPSCGFSLSKGATFVSGMPEFSLRHTEPSQGQNSGSFWNSGTGEGQQYSHHDPTHAHNGFDAFNSFPMDQNGSQGPISSSRCQWSALPLYAEPEKMTRQDSAGAHSQRSNRTSSYDQTRSSRLYSTVSQVPFMSSARSDVTGRSSPVDSGLYTPTHQLDLQTFDNFPFPGPEDVSTGQSAFRADSVHGISHANASLTTGRSFSMATATSDDTFVSMSNGANNLGSHGPISQDSVIFNPNAVTGSVNWSEFSSADPTNSPAMWNDAAPFLESQRSSPALLEDWVLPPPQMTTPTSNSPLDYSPSLDGLSPRYSQDFPDLVDLPLYTASDRAVRKTGGPRQSKVASDLANREQRIAGTSEASDESSRFVGRPNLEIDNTARDHPLYQGVTPKSDGLYHCPWEGKDGCQHKPEKLKCSYDKFVDSHLKPYKCKVVACENSRFSSTACLLRHEREAHAMHGHGDKPYLCTYQGCERGVSGNGFPRHWNLRDHMKRVHNDPGNSPPKTTAGGSPPPNLPKSKKRKAEATDGSYVGKALKKVATPPVAPVQPMEPSLIDRYQQSEHKLREIMKQLSDPRNTRNMSLLRSANDCIKVMAQMTQRMDAAPAIHFSQQQSG